MGIRRDKNATTNLETLASNLGYYYLKEVDIEAIETDLLRNIPLSLAREQRFLPLWHAEDGLVVAVSNPHQNDVISDISLFFKKNIVPVIVEEETLLKLINESYDKSAQSASAVMQAMAEDGEIDEEDLQAR